MVTFRLTILQYVGGCLRTCFVVLDPAVVAWLDQQVPSETRTHYLYEYYGSEKLQV